MPINTGVLDISKDASDGGGGLDISKDASDGGGLDISKDASDGGGPRHQQRCFGWGGGGSEDKYLYALDQARFVLHDAGMGMRPHEKTLDILIISRLFSFFIAYIFTTKALDWNRQAKKTASGTDT